MRGRGTIHNKQEKNYIHRFELLHQIVENVLCSGFLSGFLFGFRFLFLYQNGRGMVQTNFFSFCTSTVTYWYKNRTRNTKRKPERNPEDDTFTTICCTRVWFVFIVLIYLSGTWVWLLPCCCHHILPDTVSSELCVTRTHLWSSQSSLFIIVLTWHLV